MAVKDLTGKRFGKLTVLSRAPDHITNTGQKKTAWLCQCDCGTQCIKVGAELTRKKNAVQSCGCWALENRKGNQYSKKQPNEYYIDDAGVVHVQFTQNQEALVDADDLDKILEYRWYTAKSPTGIIYVAAYKRGSGKAANVQMHQIIMGCKYIDHINGDGLDNRKINLRKYTYTAENKANTGKHKFKRPVTSKYKGVSRASKEKKFRAKCGAFNLGSFETEEEAAIAYNNKASELYGEFARLNVIAGTEEVEL